MFNPVRVLKDLVRFNTSNPPGNELPALAYLQDLLRGVGAQVTIQHSAPGRGNLLALVPGSGGGQKPPLVLLSHIDVVGAEATQWKHPPFEAHEEDGYIYGRGTVDTKQLTVMELAAVCALQKAGGKPDRDVYLLATCDEESGSRYGLQYFLNNPVELAGQTLTGRQVLAGCEAVSEGGGFPIRVGGRLFYLCETGQKSVGTLRFTVPAREGKGPFLPSGDGMRRAMALVQAIGTLKLEERVLPTAGHFLNRLAQAAGGQAGWQQQLSPPMQGILRAITRNTITVTLVEGTGLNEVLVTCDVRLVPGCGREYLEGIMAPLCEKYDCTAEIVSLGEGYESAPDGPLPALLEAATREALGGEGGQAELLPFLSMGASDGRFLAPLGAKIYGYSPVLAGDMTFDTAVGMVHGVNERIHTDSLRFGCRVLAAAVLRACGIEPQAAELEV